MTEWLVVGLDSGVFWPTVETRVNFDGHEILLRPETDRLAPSVVLGYEPPMRLEKALHLVRRFLSSLAWVKSGYLRETMVTGGSHPFGVGKGPKARLIDPSFRLDYLPVLADSRARLAVALYREALGLNSKPYQFLGFYKIINILHKDGPAQKAWIDSAVHKLEDPVALQRLAEIRQQGKNIGEYLYESGRCAVAHAFNQPIVDPDDPEDTRRLAKDLPLMKALADYAVEQKLGVQSLRTIWREHMYELEGFREILGDSVIAALKSKQELDLRTVPSLPSLSLRLRNYPPFGAFENLQGDPVSAVDGRLVLRCGSQDNLLKVVLGLNFAEERLEFDAEKWVTIQDDGSELPVKKALDRVRLLQGLFSNGQLEVWDSKQEVLLGRCNPFLPVNIDLRATDENLKWFLAALSAELERRRQPSGHPESAAE